MATREASRTSTRVTTEDLLTALPTAPKRRPEPKEAFGGGGSDDDRDEDDVTKKLRRVIATGVGKKRDEVHKSELKILDQHEKAIKSNHDWRCMFVDERTGRRCEFPKGRDSKHCGTEGRNHKNYMRRKDLKARRESSRPQSPAPYPQRQPDRAEMSEHVNNLRENSIPSDAELEARLANLRQGVGSSTTAATHVVPLSELLMLRKEFEDYKKQQAQSKPNPTPIVDVTNDTAPVTLVQAPAKPRTSPIKGRIDFLTGKLIRADLRDQMEIDNQEAHEEATDAQENDVDISSQELDELNRQYYDDDADMQQ